MATAAVAGPDAVVAFRGRSLEIKPAREVAREAVAGRGTYVKIKSLGGVYVKIKQTLRGSFSAVSKQNLKVNTRWKALDEIYKTYMFLHRSDLNISATFRQLFLAFSKLEC